MMNPFGIDLSALPFLAEVNASLGLWALACAPAVGLAALLAGLAVTAVRRG